MACVVVVLAVRIIFRLDKTIGWARRGFGSREEVAHFSNCAVTDPPNFQRRLEGKYLAQGERGERTEVKR